MKRGILIGGGILILIILISVWLYLLFFGTPKSGGEIFTNLGFTGGEDRPLQELESESIVDTTPDPEALAKFPLKLLSNRPASGFVITTTAGYPKVRFAERGVGHVYEINLFTGEETSVSKMTVPQSVEAVFSPDGSSVVYSTYIDNTRSSFVAELGLEEGSPETQETIPLPPNPSNIAYENNRVILYTLENQNGTKGYSYNLDTQVRQELFSLKIRQLKIVWGHTIEGIYTYTKPSPLLEGYAYEIRNNTLIPIGNSGASLVMLKNDVASIYTYTQNRVLFSETVTPTKTLYQTDHLLLPEKCTFSRPDSVLMWCAVPEAETSTTFIDAWYKGTLTSDDTFWFFNLETGQNVFFLSPLTAAGRKLDVTNMSMVDDWSKIVFRNKTDNTLWVFDPALVQ